jgi:hypothetical protein
MANRIKRHYDLTQVSTKKQWHNLSSPQVNILLSSMGIAGVTVSALKRVGIEFANGRTKPYWGFIVEETSNG